MSRTLLHSRRPNRVSVPKRTVSRVLLHGQIDLAKLSWERRKLERRDWKKNKTLNLKKIKDLEFDLKKIASENNG